MSARFRYVCICVCARACVRACVSMGPRAHDMIHITSLGFASGKGSDLGFVFSPKPYTLYPTPYTLHPIPRAFHITLYLEPFT